MNTLMHPQVMPAWMLNDRPIPPKHGAPLRLIIPFRYGARSIKAMTEIYFGSPGLPVSPLPAAGWSHRFGASVPARAQKPKSWVS